MSRLPDHASAHPAPDGPGPSASERAHHRFWPKRLPHRIRPPATSLWDNLEVSARRYPDKPALVFFNHITTYRELLAQATRLAAHLHTQGVQPGDRVLLLMQNAPQWVVAHFAILRANAVVVPVNPMNRAAELGHTLTDPDVQVAICAADLAAELLKANAELPAAQRLRHLVVAHYLEHQPGNPSSNPPGQALDSFGPPADMPPAWADWLATRHPLPSLPNGTVADWAEALGCTAAPPPHNRQPDDLSVLPYTSGTTGLPKGCMHTHASLMHNAVASALWGNSTPENVSLVVVPMFHITGMVVGMHAGIYTGATLVLMPRWDRDLAGRLISQWRVTHWTNIPTMVMDLLASPHFAQYDLSSLVLIGGGGAAMPQAVAQRLWEHYGLRYAEGYGLTETAAPSHNNPPDAPKQQCLGIPFMGVDARVVDPDSLQEMPTGEAGEIIIRGPSVFAGYWKRPEATEVAFITFEGQRYFRSGDLGRVDEDGYFFITDRLKRMINASGFKVWPAEVEALMFRHPAIAEACVIATQDAYRGESVKAVVVLRDSARGQVSEQDILAWCRDNMAVYKCPRVVQLADALPKSGSGKVMWRLLQAQETASAQNPAPKP
jgi:fatty-acyl-CoA synthase